MEDSLMLRYGRKKMSTTQMAFQNGAGEIEDPCEPGTQRERAHMRSIVIKRLVDFDEDELDEEEDHENEAEVDNNQFLWKM